ncbi:MAG: MscL family protein [Candidatus Hermodarchaeota archaeon]|nr:MscL family protein [Candidatus Hermodarchaeota archaeon]
MSKEDQMLEELKRIREAIEPAPPPPPPEKRGLWQEFKDFLKEYKVMGLAVAFIMALYLGRLVSQLVASFITPILSVLFVSIGWEAPPIATFTPTLFIQELITFLVVAFVIFILVKITSRLGIE